MAALDSMQIKLAYLQCMDAYNLETFKALDRYRYLRSNFVAAYHGGSRQHRKRDLGTLQTAQPLHCQLQSNKRILRTIGIPRACTSFHRKVRPPSSRAA